MGVKNRDIDRLGDRYSVKTISMKVEDVDTATRRVKVALSALNEIDSDKDLIKPGAYLKSISERGPNASSNRKIAFLRYHDWEHQIGKWAELSESGKYLIGVGDLGRSTKGEDALLDYQDEIILEHSIGFNYIKDKMRKVGEGDAAYYEISEVKLWEGSAVTFGANEFTPTLDVSKGNKVEVLDKLNKQMTAFIDAIKNGKGSDERLFSIEMGLKICQEKYNSLINFDPLTMKDDIDETEPSEIEKQERESRDQKKKLFFINSF